MAGVNPKIPTLADYARARELGSVVSTSGAAGGPKGPPADLVSYIAKNLPAWSDINRNHVYIGLGVAFVGITGAAIAYSTLSRSASDPSLSAGAEAGAGEAAGPVEVVKRRKSVTYAPYTGLQQEVKRRQNIGSGPPAPRPEGVLILHQCPRGRKTPCIAPYPLKLETFLRTHGINYEVSWEL